MLSKISFFCRVYLPEWVLGNVVTFIFEMYDDLISLNPFSFRSPESPLWFLTSMTGGRRYTGLSIPLNIQQKFYDHNNHLNLENMIQSAAATLTPFFEHKIFPHFEDGALEYAISSLSILVTNFSLPWSISRSIIDQDDFNIWIVRAV